jgi:hypothetical protein
MPPRKLAHQREIRHHRISLHEGQAKNRGRPDGEDGSHKERERLHDEPEIGAKGGPFDEAADRDRENQNESDFERAKRECRHNDAGVPIDTPSRSDGFRQKNKTRERAEREELVGREFRGPDHGVARQEKHPGEQCRETRAASGRQPEAAEIDDSQAGGGNGEHDHTYAVLAQAEP